jgi:hypothetical protein
MKKALAFLALILVTSSLYSQWMEMSVLLNESVWASSSLSETIRGRLITYGPEALFDGDLSFPWVEGSPESGIGESVTILTNRPINGFSLTNGFAGSSGLLPRDWSAKQIIIFTFFRKSRPVYLYLSKTVQLLSLLTFN